MASRNAYVFIAGTEFYGWMCHNCGWLQAAPRGGPEDALKHALEALNLHRCADAAKAASGRCQCGEGQSD